VGESADGLTFKKRDDSRKARQLHGLCRTLGNNMVLGVSQGWKKNLQLVGVGYRANANQKQLTLQLGYSHDVVMDIPEGVKVEVDKGSTNIEVSGYDKEVVGNAAATVRMKRPPEPYKGKGVRYLGEYVAMKEGKAGKK